MTAPEGFEPSARTGPFVEHLGTLYTRDSPAGIELALEASEQHLNARGFVHGGVLCALLDMVTGRNAAAVEDRPPQSLLTASLTVNFLSAAGLGDWLIAAANVRRQGRRLAFADGHVHVEGTLIATSTVVFAAASTEAP